MICDICKQNEATVHITKVINGKITLLNLCEKCAKDKKNLDVSQAISINDFLKDIIKITENDIDALKRKTKVKYKETKCNKCGTTYEELIENGTVGCSECYKVFSKDITEILLRVYGDVKQKETKVKKTNKHSIERENLRMLKLKLKRALEIENYDEAANLRDMIKKVEDGKKKKK